MIRRVVLVIASLVLCGHGIAAVDLDATLTRLSRVAELYRDSALGFACEETIVAIGQTSRRVQFAYIFIKDEDGRLRDFRTWKSGTSAKQRGQEVDPRDYKVPRYLASAYLWAFAFRSDRQPRHRFQFMGEDNALDRPALKIQFVPVPPVVQGVNDWAGFAWVDAKTSQMLKFEAYSTADWDKRTQILADVAAAPTANPRDEKEPVLIDKVITEFGVVKNGMRFPSHVELSTTRTAVKYGRTGDPLHERVLDKVVQDYSKFEFFSVRTSEEISRFVNGGRSLSIQPPEVRE